MAQPQTEPPEQGDTPPQAPRKVIDKPYIDRNGNYVIPADLVPYWGTNLKEMLSEPPNYEKSVRALKSMFRGAGPVTTGPDGSVIIPAEAVVTHFPHCDRTCSYQAMDLITKMTFDAIHQFESGVIPAQEPQIRRNYPPPCSLEQLRLARKYQNGGPDYALRAMELCPLEMCPYLGNRLIQSRNPDWAMRAARMCPQL
jgi:hypothetical protein